MDSSAIHRLFHIYEIHIMEAVFCPEKKSSPNVILISFSIFNLLKKGNLSMILTGKRGIKNILIKIDAKVFNSCNLVISHKKLKP